MKKELVNYNREEIKIKKEDLELIQKLALEFMQSACVTQDMNANSLSDFIGWLRWLKIEEYDSKPYPIDILKEWIKENSNMLDIDKARILKAIKEIYAKPKS